PFANGEPIIPETPRQPPVGGKGLSRTHVLVRGRRGRAPRSDLVASCLVILDVSVAATEIVAARKSEFIKCLNGRRSPHDVALIDVDAAQVVSAVHKHEPPGDAEPGRMILD